MKTIAIAGATGMIGRQVTHAFINAGFGVTVMVRNINKAKNLFGNQVRYIQGDLEDSTAIDKFLKGQKNLYLNLSVQQNSRKDDFQPEREGLNLIITSARKASIQRIGYLSSLVHAYEGQNGFHWWVFDLKHKAVEAIRNSGIAYSIFYPSTFMENFDKGAYRQGNFLLLSGNSRFKMFLISAYDFGEQVVKAFELNNGHNEFVIQGKEGFNADEAAYFFKKHYKGANLRVVKFPFAMLKLMGRLHKKYDFGAKMIEALNNFPEKFDASATWEILGKPQTGFMDYIKAEQ